MKRILLTLLLVVTTMPLLSLSSYGQKGHQDDILSSDVDTLRRAYQMEERYSPLVDRMPLTAAVGVGVPLLAFDFMHFRQDLDYRAIRNYYAPSHHYRYDDFLMFAPLAITWGSRLAGIQGRSESIIEATTAQCFTLALATGVTQAGKALSKRMRPDDSTRNSFPSGHTTFAFASAAILDAEYGAKYPWLSVLGYTTATMTATARVLNNRHWMTDVVTGAGVGMAGAYLGYYLSDLIFGQKGRSGEFLTAQSDGLWLIGIEKGFHTYFGSIGDYQSDGLGNVTALSLRVPLTHRLGIRLQGSLLESHNNAIGEGLQGQVYLAKVSYMYPLCQRRLFFDFEAGAGYGSEIRLQVGEESYEHSAPFVTRSLPLTMGIGTMVSLMPHFGLRLGADYIYAFNGRPYSRDTKNGLSGLSFSLSMNYILQR